MTSQEPVDLLQRLTPACEPLPPQRWGFLPTEQFWSLAALTPISAAFWFVALFFYDRLCSFGLPWWQNGLGFAVFTAVWAGFLERWSRRYFAHRLRRALSSMEWPFNEAPIELVPTDEPQRRLPVFATPEFWDYAFARLFGRAKLVASMLFEFVFYMAAFYPSWRVFSGSILVLLSISLGLGWWQRRLIRAQLEGPRTGPALVDGSPRPALQPGDDDGQLRV